MQNARCPRGPGETAATARNRKHVHCFPRIRYSECNFQRQVKATGGRWDVNKKPRGLCSKSMSNASLCEGM